MVQHIDINGIQKIWQIPQGKNEQEPKAKATSKTLWGNPPKELCGDPNRMRLGFLIVASYLKGYVFNYFRRFLYTAVYNNCFLNQINQQSG